MLLVEEDYGKIAGEWAGETEFQRKQRTTEGRRTNEQMDRKEEPRVMLLRFKSRVHYGQFKLILQS